ncbi:MAG: hypothetical protein U0325_34350 [Polyangiales bacterium]
MVRLWPLLLLLGCEPRNEVPYGACRASGECAASTPRCVNFMNAAQGRNTQIKLCTATCTSNADCAENGVCMNPPAALNGGRAVERLCVQRCVTNDVCRFVGAICPEVSPGENGCVP